MYAPPLTTDKCHKMLHRITYNRSNPIKVNQSINSINIIHPHPYIASPPTATLSCLVCTRGLDSATAFGVAEFGIMPRAAKTCNNTMTQQSHHISS